jgi:hypothetical protein
MPRIFPIRNLIPDLFFITNHPCVPSQTSIPPWRDNDNLIGAARRVSVSQNGHGSRPKPILGHSLTTKRAKIAAKSLVLEDFTATPLNPKI